MKEHIVNETIILLKSLDQFAHSTLKECPLQLRGHF